MKMRGWFTEMAKSNWVETSYIIGDTEITIPLRCCIEARKNRLRTLIQKYNEDQDQWVLVHKSAWVKSSRAHYLPESRLDEAACHIADTIEDVVAKGVLEGLGR